MSDEGVSHDDGGTWVAAAVGAVMIGFALGVAVGFAHSLLRRRPSNSPTGYLPPVAAVGPRAVPPPTLVPSQPVSVGSDTSIIAGE